MASNPTSKELKRVKKTLSEIEKNIKKTVAFLHWLKEL